MTVHVQDASIEEPSWYDRYAAIGELDSVVEVLAPKVLFEAGLSREERYKRAWTKFDRARRRGMRISGWRDTYFERLTKQNPGLEQIVQKVLDWKNGSQVGLYLHTDFPGRQALRPLGSPCLQYVQFHASADAISLTALYRSHDYEEKALGNLIGLTRLVRFVAMESGRSPREVLCVSLNPHCTSKTRLRELLNA